MTEKSILQGTKINSTFLALYFLFFMIRIDYLKYVRIFHRNIIV